MRFIPLACLLLLAGCAENATDTGISRARAISIAEAHCPEYPGRFPVVDRSEWSSSSRCWAVSLTNHKRKRGKVFKINRNGDLLDIAGIDLDEESWHYNRFDAPYQHYGQGPWYGYYW